MDGVEQLFDEVRFRLEREGREVALHLVDAGCSAENNVRPRLGQHPSEGQRIGGGPGAGRPSGFEPATLTWTRWWFPSPWLALFPCHAVPSTQFPSRPPSLPLSQSALRQLNLHGRTAKVDGRALELDRLRRNCRRDPRAEWRNRPTHYRPFAVETTTVPCNAQHPAPMCGPGVACSLESYGAGLCAYERSVRGVARHEFLILVSASGVGEAETDQHRHDPSERKRRDGAPEGDFSYQAKAVGLEQ